MPSLFRFLVSAGSLVALVSGGLYILAHQFEPERHEVVKAVPGVKIRKP
jgi:phosphoserine phosphatase